MHLRIIWVALFVATFLSTAHAAPPSETSEEAPEPKLTRAPELKTFIEADYPELARQEGRTGTVGLALTIQSDGSVIDLEIVKSASPDLDAAALEAVKQFTFIPAELDGKPGVVRITYDYTFTLEEQVEEVEAPPTEIPSGMLRGQLLERGGRGPLAGLTVRLPAYERETFTNAKGVFEFTEVPAGEVEFIISDASFVDVEDTETVEVGKVTEITFYLERDGFDDSVTVVGRRPKKQVVRRTLSIQEIRTIPGTQGDALKVIQNLPGVARQTFADEIILRGGGRSQVYLDEHPIPLAFHFGGLRSTVSSGLIETIDVYPGNFGAEFGRVNGGIIGVNLRSPATDRFRGVIEADVFDAGFLLEGPLSDHWSMAFAGRRSYIDAILPAVLPKKVLKNFKVSPRYYDSQLLLEGRYGSHRIRAAAYLSSDSLEFLFPQDDEGDAGLDFGQDWGGARLEWLFRGDRFQNTLSISYLREDSDIKLNLGGPKIGLNTLEQKITLRDTVTLELADWLQARVGTDSELIFAKFGGRVPAPPQEGEPVSAGLPNRDLYREFNAKSDALSPSLWADAEFKLGDYKVLPSVRLDYFGGPEDLIIQPRLAVRYQVSPAHVLKAAVGVYAEPPQPSELSKEFGDPKIDSERSMHYSLGIESQLTESLSIDFVGFYKTLDDLITRVDDPKVQVRNQGEGRAYGAEVLLRHDMTNRFFGWVAYTLMKSERRDQPGAEIRAFDLDQTHNLTVVAQYKLTPTWDIGLRFRYVTGNPTTPVNRADFDADEGTFVPVYGKINSDRVAAFHQLDLRVDKHWIFDNWKLTAYLDVQNVYNRKNPEGIEHSFDYRESAIQAGLPIIPSIGIRGEF